MASKHIDQLPSHHIIAFRNNKYMIKAPLPDGITIGVGGDVTAPFSGFASEGTASSLISYGFGASQKTGLFTKKLWMGPDQPDLTFELKFEAYYSAFDEVLAPCYGLMLMSAGDEKKVLNESKELKKKIESSLGTIGVSEQATQRLTDLITFLQAPDNVDVVCGKYLSIKDAIVSNVNITFSNVLDSLGNPMAAEATVTITPSTPFTKARVDQLFSSATGRPKTLS